MFNERIGVLKEESDLHRGWPATLGDRPCLRVSAGDFNVLMFCEELISDMVDWYAIDGDKDASRTLAKGTEEINDFFYCGWSGRCVMCGRDLW